MPPAPRPIRDSHGNEVAPWFIRMEYSPLTDEIIVTRHQDAGPYHKAHTESTSYGVVDVEDAIAAVQRAARVCGARRLF